MPRGSSFLPSLPSARVSPRASSTLRTPRPPPPFSPGRAHQASPQTQTPCASSMEALDTNLEQLRALVSQSRTNAKLLRRVAARAYATAEEAERGKAEHRSMARVPPEPRPKASHPRRRNPPPRAAAATYRARAAAAATYRARAAAAAATYRSRARGREHPRQEGRHQVDGRRLARLRGPRTPRGDSAARRGL